MTNAWSYRIVCLQIFDMGYKSQKPDFDPDYKVNIWSIIK